MKFFLRPAVTAILSLAVVGTAAAESQFSHLLRQLNPLMSHSAAGYLGVLVSDVDNESAARLKLKDSHGALITLIDHDAPAGPVLRVTDVVLQVNGQNVENAEQFGRALKEMPAGRKVSFVINREGTLQTVTVQLCDRKVMEQDVWNKLNKGEGASPVSGMALMGGGGSGDAPSGGFHMPLFAGSLHVGAAVEPLTAQMADYLGVPAGVIVKHVERKSEASVAGIKEFDVVLKVGAENIRTTADWDRALRANEGKGVQVIVLRDRKQQTLNLQVDSKRKG